MLSSQYSAPQDQYAEPVVELDRLGLEQDAAAIGLEQDAAAIGLEQDAAAIDVEGARAAIADLLIALGRDPSDPHLAETPRRVARAFEEMLTARPAAWTTFPNTDGYTDLLIVKDIPFHSLCQHHLLPFRGVAHIGYIPGDRLIGLSKLARGLELFARDLQLQERLTVQVADWLMETLDARGAGAVLEAEHLCMSLRGVEASGALTTTSAFRGELNTPGPQQDRFFSK